MVAIGRGRARFPTSGRSSHLLSATGNPHLGGATRTSHFNFQLTRITGSSMTPRCALVILAVECLAAHLLTWWAVSEAALLIAGVSLAVPHLPALCFAGESFSTLHLLLPRPAPALLHLHLQTRWTRASVTSLSAGVAATSKHLATGIAACGRGLRAGQLDNRLATWAVSVQGERAWRAGAWRVADVVAVVEAAREQRPTRMATLELWS